MLTRRSELQRVTLLNPKGGSGKTTIATNLASYYTGSGFKTAMFDYDAQGSTTRWLQARGDDYEPIQGVAAHRNAMRMTRSWQLRLDPQIERLVVDTAAGVLGADLNELIRRTDIILIPVLRSRIDIDAVRDFIAELIIQPAVKRGEVRAAIVANRVRSGSMSQQLKSFLAEQPLPHIATLRESANYLRAAELGCGVHELEGPRVEVDREQWAPLIRWLECEEATPVHGSQKRVSALS